MSSDDGPHQTRDQIMKIIDDTTRPLIEPIKAHKESFVYYMDTGYEHSKRVGPMFRRKWQNLEDKTSQNMSAYHHYRRQFGWEMIFGTGLGFFVCSLPYGLQATSRNALFATAAATLLVNPEYLYDQYKFYSSGGVKAKDSSNKTSFRW